MSICKTSLIQVQGLPVRTSFKTCSRFSFFPGT